MLGRLAAFVPGWVLPVVAGVAMAGSFAAGWRLSADHLNASHNAELLDQALAYAKAVTESVEFGDRVAADYAAVVSWQHGRIRTRTEEVIRETTRHEYHCPVLATGRLLINAAVRDANAAAALRLDRELRAAP